LIQNNENINEENYMIHLIETTSDLETFCQHLSSQPFITVDLEFLREKTYYAELCLIQVGTTEQAAIIDPLSHNLDLSLFFNILTNSIIIPFTILLFLHNNTKLIEI
jgi:ribonuclease D